jgi:hypothetical protein
VTTEKRLAEHEDRLARALRAAKLRNSFSHRRAADAGYALALHDIARTVLTNTGMTVGEESSDGK